MPGSTKSGSTLEQLIGPVLLGNGYTYDSQKVIGLSLSGKKHRVDALISLPGGQQVPLSLKWQEVSGTAEEKVPYEVIKLIHAVKQ
ncbi:MAG TPA: PD-(D/E)XK nuclease superfamily protein, partial [Herpetosiphonaceae bacterium]